MNVRFAGFPSAPLRRLTRVLCLGCILSLSACAAARESAPMAAPADETVAGSASMERAQSDPGGAALPDSDAAAPGSASGAGDSSGLRIIKEATMSIVVDKLETGLGRLETVAAQGGGYITEKQTDFSNIYHRTASLAMAVKVDDFEATMDRIRKLAISVDSEAASGVDVSQQYVDLDSEIANLEATQARIRGFLDQAKTVEEALQVNAQLTSIEGEIGIRKGRLKDLGQRSSFSTIRVNVNELAPQISPTPEPTATPGPGWDPGGQAGDAFRTLRGLLQVLGNLAIWLLIVGLPLILIFWLLSRLLALLGFRSPWRRSGGPRGEESGS